jgi:hypothetical protein
MKRFLVGIATMLLMASVGHAFTDVYEGNMSSGPICTSRNLDLSLPALDKLSVEGTYYPMSFSSTTYTDGHGSTGTITIVSSATVAGSTLTIQGINFVEGLDWTASGLSSNTALSLYNILVSTYGIFSSGGYLTVKTTYSLSLSSFTINYTTYVEHTDWFVSDTTSGTAESIKSLLQSQYGGILLTTRTTNSVSAVACNYGAQYNWKFSSFTSSITAQNMTGGRVAPLSGINFSRAATEAVIYATTTVIDPNLTYTITSSTPALLVTGISGGVNSDIDYSNNRIVKSNNYPQGLAVLYTVIYGSSPVKLSNNTTYYVIAGDGSYFSLASSTQNAADKNELDLIKQSQSGTFKINPLAFPPTPSGYSMYWKASNDGENYFNLNVSSLTYSTVTYILSSSTGISNGWDFGTYNYKYLRAVWTAGVSGALNVILRYFGKY